MDFGPLDLRYTYPSTNSDNTFSVNRQELFDITKQHLITVMEAEFGTNVQEVQLLMTSTRFNVDPSVNALYVTEQITGVVVFVEPAIVLSKTIDDLLVDAFQDNGLALYLFRLQIATDATLQSVETVDILGDLNLGGGDADHGNFDDDDSSNGGNKTKSNAFEWDTVTVAIVASVGSAFVMVVVFVVYIFCKRRKDRKNKGADLPLVATSSSMSRGSRTSRRPSNASTTKAASVSFVPETKPRSYRNERKKRTVPPPTPPIEDPEENASTYSYADEGVKDHDEVSVTPSYLFSINEGTDDDVDGDNGVEVETNYVIPPVSAKRGSFQQNDAAGKDQKEVAAPKNAKRSSKLLGGDNSTASGASNSLLMFGDNNSLGSQSKASLRSKESKSSSNNNLVDRVPPGSPGKSTTSLKSTEGEGTNTLSSTTPEKKERKPFQPGEKFSSSGRAELAASHATSARKRKSKLSSWSKSSDAGSATSSEQSSITTEARLRNLLENETRRHSTTAIDGSGSLRSKTSRAASQPSLLTGKRPSDNSTSGSGIPSLMFTRKVHNDDSSSEEEVYVEDEERSTRPFQEQGKSASLFLG